MGISLRKHRGEKRERGAAVIEMVMAVPVLVILICGIVDLSTYIKVCTTVDTAATVATRYIVDDPSLTPDRYKDEAKIRKCVNDSFAEDLGGLDVKVSYNESKLKKETYTHHFYTEETNDDITSMTRTNCQLTYQPFTVTVTYQGEWWTPFGRLIGRAVNEDHSADMVVTSKQAGQVDLTQGGGANPW